MNRRVVVFGEALLRLSAPGNLRISQCNTFDVSFGGAEVNVALSLANYGVNSEFVTRLPQNDVADACLRFFRGYGVGLDHVLRGGDRIGLFYYETGAAQRPSQVIYDRANSAISQISPGMVDWNSVFKDTHWFHTTGITPALSKSAADTVLEAVKMAKEMGLTVSCDLNYRSKLWKWGKEPIEIMPEIVKYVDVIIGNEEDAEKVLGVKPTDTNILSGNIDSSKYIQVCEELKKKFTQLSTIAFTIRGSLSASHNTWSGVVWQNGQFYTGSKYDIWPIVDRLGGGDSFAAGLIYGLISFNGDYKKALDFGIAASCLKHSIQFDLNLVSKSEVEKLLSGDSSGRVAR